MMSRGSASDVYTDIQVVPSWAVVGRAADVTAQLSTTALYYYYD